MLEVVRHDARAAARGQTQVNWGIVDAILALVMLPFAVWMWVIDRLVWAVAALTGRWG